ncbi:heterokaryon incompatibility protein-domain-containing protein [Pisolithus thermaeus]|nr:heterokaryon incompatibility protein-domain-containing protein [Pisolithus thermaeus]
MKLLDVEAVLDRETDIQQNDPEREVMKELDDENTRYAILSHRWGAEVDYKEMTRLMKMEERKRNEVRQRSGYQKIIESCKQAMKDGYKWLWVDTCCIDKRSSSELTEAINSMYRWYQSAQVCYAYLNDVDESTFPTEGDHDKFAESNGWPEWFMRGWTLQELIAPKEVEFFNKDWVHIGNKQHLEFELQTITGIPYEVLTSGLAGKRLSVAQIMSWAAKRKTTREEDRAYSLMGLFGVNLPMLYGEGKKAFRRLQLEIIREFNDQSILAWKPRVPRTGSVLAEDPSDFRGCGKITKVEPGEFIKLIGQYTWRSDIGDSWAQPQYKLAALRDVMDSQQFHTFNISNGGIQVFLPVIPSRDSPSHLRAVLACTRDLDLVTIDLVSSGRSFARTSIDSLLPATYAEVKTLYLIHHQDTNETRHEFPFDDKYVSSHGFTRRGTYPREFTGNTITLSSLAEDLIVIVYANHDARSCFAIGLGYYLGQEWVHVDYDGHFPTQEDWTDFGGRAYDRMWKARARHARDMAEYRDMRYGKYCMKHAHLPRSIWAVRVIWGRWKADDFSVMVDVVECPGCCDGPYSMTDRIVGTFCPCAWRANRVRYLRMIGLDFLCRGLWKRFLGRTCCGWTSSSPGLASVLVNGLR